MTLSAFTRVSDAALGAFTPVFDAAGGSASDRMKTTTVHSPRRPAGMTAALSRNLRLLRHSCAKAAVPGTKPP
jgi:hypothetical protein